MAQNVVCCETAERTQNVAGDPAADIDAGYSDEQDIQPAASSPRDSLSLKGVKAVCEPVRPIMRLSRC